MKTIKTQPIRLRAGVLCALFAGVGVLLAADTTPTTVSTNTPVVTNATVNANTATHAPAGPATGKTLSAPALSKPSGAASGKKIEVSGPVVQPLKEKGFKNGARRFFNLFNPFAPVEKKEQVVRSTNSEAWSTVAERNAKGSAWSDEKTHKSQAGLVNVACPDVPK